MAVLCFLATNVKAQRTDSLYFLLSQWYGIDTSGRNDTGNIQQKMLVSNFSINRPAFNKPFLSLGNGLLSMQYTHQSFIDTPFMGGSLSNRQFMYQQQIKVFDFFPVGFTMWGRSTNSPFYRDILDVQLIYDKHTFSNQNREAVLNAYYRELKRKYSDELENGLADYRIKLAKLESITSMQDINQLKLELKEIISVKEKSFDYSLSDSLNLQRYDSIRDRSNKLLSLIEKFEHRRNQYERSIDSLNEKLSSARTRINGYKSKAQRLSLLELTSELAMNNKGDKYPKNAQLSRWLKLISGIQSFRLGRAPLDAGELTSRNMSLNGLQFSYNSWYILGVAIGSLDYRFRDVGLSPKAKNWAPYWSVKLGVGKLSDTYLAVSYFNGNKLLGSQFNQGTRMRISGAVLEGQTRISKYGFIKAELAQSSSPDFRPQQVSGQTKIGSINDANLATALRVNLNFHRTGTRVDALYRKSGSNFQSFSTWQVNTEQEQWYVKLDQSVWKNRLKLSGAVRKQDFSNPFFTQKFQSNTVFKTATASLRIPRWPSLLVGYIPVSQYALVGEQVVEARFQTITAQVFHYYRIGKIMTSTQFLFNQNLNSAQSAFVYNNVRSLFFNQTFLFKVFTSQFSVSDTRNAIYNLLVLDNRVNFPLLKNRLQIGAGVKLGRYNEKVYKVGGSGNLSIQLRKGDQFQLQWDKSFLPTEANGLRYNDMASILFVKAIDFSTKAKRSKSGL